MAVALVAVEEEEERRGVEVIARVLREGPPLSRSLEAAAAAVVLGCAFLPLPVAPTPTAAAVRPALPRTTTTKTHTTTANDHHHYYATTRTRRCPRTTTTRTTPPTTAHRIILNYTHTRCRRDFRWGCELSTCLLVGVRAWESTAACRSDLGTALGRTEEEEEDEAQDPKLEVRG